jgi:Tfp pilus assembly protein PilO
MDKRILVFLILFVLVFEFKYIYLPNKKKLDNLTKLISKKENIKKLVKTKRVKVLKLHPISFLFFHISMI